MLVGQTVTSYNNSVDGKLMWCQFFSHQVRSKKRTNIHESTRHQPNDPEHKLVGVVNDSFGLVPGIKHYFWGERSPRRMPPVLGVDGQQLMDGEVEVELQAQLSSQECLWSHLHPSLSNPGGKPRSSLSPQCKSKNLLGSWEPKGVSLARRKELFHEKLRLGPVVWIPASALNPSRMFGWF
jgi:hypothetical protein